MTEATLTPASHTPGTWVAVPPACEREDWSVGIPSGDKPAITNLTGICIATVHDARPRTPTAEANARLIAAAPLLFAELRETAEWLDDRANQLRRIAKSCPRTNAGRGLASLLRAEAARHEGRAAIVRQTVLRARGQ